MSNTQLTVSWVTQINSLDVFIKFIPISQAELSSYKKYSALLQVFEVSYEGHHWTVVRTMDQMLDFLQFMQKKYSVDDGKKVIVQNGPVPRILNFMSNKSIDIKDQKVVQFFEIYDMEFNKVKSLKLNKNAGGRYRNQFCCNCSILQWKKRQFVITQNGIMYFKIRDSRKKICQYISFNKYFSFQLGMETGDQFGILIKSYHRRLRLKADNFLDFISAIYFLDKAFKQYNQGRLNNKYGSFAPQRDNNLVQFLVDGQEYFGAVAEELSKAKYQVMIAGWWISPEFYLVRPIDPRNPERNRLSTILKSITSQNNVKIYVLAYRESPYFLPNDSNYTKKALQSISPNIKVITHPINIIPSLWSHHEKIVIIDQKVAFIGGLDLCYGRYDTSQHSILDKQNLYPGIQFNNSRIKDFSKVRDFQISNIMRSQHPRLPWHDVAIKLIGGSVSDVVKHFVQYWNFASYQALYQERIVLVPSTQKITNKFKNLVSEFKSRFLNPKDEEQNQNQLKRSQSKTLNESKVLDKNRRRPEIQKQEKSEKKKQKKAKIKKSNTFQVHQYQKENNETIKQIIPQEIHDKGDQINTENFLKTHKTNNDLESGEEEVYRYTSDENQGKSQKKQSTTNQSLERNNRVSLPSPMRKLGLRKKIRKISVPNKQDQQQEYDSDNGDYLNQKYFDLQNQQNVKKEGKFMQILRRIQSFDQAKSRKTRKMTEPVQKSSKNKLPVQIEFRNDNCQVLRSVSKWSIGCKQTQSQSSIHEAYIDMISKAQHFIYIENQFFMSATQGHKVLKNQVAKALIERISRAIHQRKKFRVVFLMPLIPGFAGQLDAPDAILPRVILHWQYQTIFQSQNSVIKSILKLTPDPSKYIQFYGLRTHDLINDEPKTQIVYLHTKLMIVDDKKAIIGSANINDRSMRGTRDSEIAVQIIGGDMIQSTVDDKPFMVSEKIKSLRLKLMKEHFGHTDQNGQVFNFTDIMNSRLFQRMQKLAKQNTQTYRKLFGCYPDDKIQNLKQIKDFKRSPTRQEYLQSADKIRGHVVLFPYKFLCKENLLQGNSIYPNGITT